MRDPRDARGVGFQPAGGGDFRSSGSTGQNLDASGIDGGAAGLCVGGQGARRDHGGAGAAFLLPDPGARFIDPVWHHFNF